MDAKSIAHWAEMLTSSEFEPLSGQTKDCIRLEFVASPLSM